MNRYRVDLTGVKMRHSYTVYVYATNVTIVEGALVFLDGETIVMAFASGEWERLELLDYAS